MSDQFPDDWRKAVAEWAKEKSLITAIYLFGSRAKGTARDDSDIDLAYETRASELESPFTVAFFNGKGWQQELQSLLPRPVDFQYADREGDEVVWPAVLDHGVRLA